MIRKVFPDIHGGNVWKTLREKDVKTGKIIDFSASINPLGFPSGVKNRICDCIKKLVHYPDPDYFSLRREIAQYLKTRPEEILAGNGSIELINLIIKRINPSKILIPVPSFMEYERAALINGSKTSFLYMKKEDDFRFDKKQLLSRLKDINMLFLCNPGSPTGHTIEKSELSEIAVECDKKGIWLIVDEAFIEFAEDTGMLTLVKEATKKKRLIVIRSVTKFFGMPGIRLGYLVAERGVVESLKNIQEPWNVNIIASLLGKECFRDKEFILKSRRYLKREKEYLSKELKKLKEVCFYPSDANFFLVRIDLKKNDSHTLALKMKKKGILIRDCTRMRGLDKRYFRFAVKKRSENKEFLRVLKEVLNESI